jgi:alginate O-acetyltransferase complex protein AlgI
MLHGTINILLSFLLVVTVCYAMPARFRWIFLLLFSLYFYGCYKTVYIILLIAVSTIVYFAGLRIAREELLFRRRLYLAATIASILAILVTFKYLNFIGGSVNGILRHFNLLHNAPELKILAPVGISFYTLKALSYSIDVYRGDIRAERHFGMLFLYISFFPQILAGPIERAAHLLPQFRNTTGFDSQRIIDGCKLMLWGFFKKIVIADQFAIYVNQVFNHPLDYQGAVLIIAAYLFTIQIYCDFSGYSDIAIGAAQILGYDTRDNFNRPYLAQSLQDFWHRWHISLSTWFRDYLYIPLGGKRVSLGHWHLNILAVFVLSGFWHGANYTFLIWGALHGAFLSLSALTAGARRKAVALFHLERIPRFHKALRIFVTFHIVVFAWIFFRANSISDAFLIIGNMLPLDMAHFSIPKAVELNYLFVALMAGALLFAVELIQRQSRIDDTLRAIPIWCRWSFYYLLIFAIILFGQRAPSQFIYTRF